MKIPVFQIDTFTNRLFAGNPAAVCPLGRWLTDAKLGAIAAENNLSETAFFVERQGHYELRWFTPTVEVDLCGHATLAAAFVIFGRLAPHREVAVFETRSGRLSVRRNGGRYLALDFPRIEARPCGTSRELTDALGKRPRRVLATKENYMAVFDSEEDIATITPDMDKVAGLTRNGVIITSTGKDADFVSRYFAPAIGIPEDPVTGSSHCTLIPYWSQRLARAQLHALQLSKRGGELICEDRGERVVFSGQAVEYMEGTILSA